MKLLFQSSFLALVLVATQASQLPTLEDPTDPTCTLKGSAGKDACDSSQAADGSDCVWCEVSGYGLCVDDDQAEIIEQAMPGAECGDDVTDDDDAAPADDDTPSDYWKCLKSSTDADSCAALGCTWCDTKGGYGLCMDKDAAESANSSDWFTCATTDKDIAELALEEVAAMDPFDTSCLAASVEMDEDACKGTTDEDGNPCEWCNVGGTPLCLNAEQADVAEQLGGSCDAVAFNPFDTSCLAASVQMDEDACRATKDEEGNPCEWCNVGSTPLCLTPEQATIAFGHACDAVADPYDPSCLAASIQLDEDACKATKDEDGNACEWCMVGSTPLCLNEEQADIASQIGASCDDVIVSDPYDTSCLAATISGDEDTCVSTKDVDGGNCEWCTIGSVQMCLNAEQGDIAGQLGGSCDASIVEQKVEADPFDTSCLVATVQMDKDACLATTDEDGNGCEWCTVSTSLLCLTEDQAEIATQLGGNCDTLAAIGSATE